ncbi:MAG: ParB/RepB/Spo0J family partition protein, partial [Isosphaeraceae bacterium]
ERLAQSLKTRGLLPPLRVRWDAGLDRFVILCGERRWRAARLAGLESLACVIIEGDLSPQERLAVQLVENALREDLRPIEQAKAYKTLMDDQVWTVRQLAAELAIHHGQVVRAMALLELPAPVRDQVEQGSLAPATAYEISKVEDEDTRQRLAQRVIAEGLSRDETIAEVRAASERRTGKAKGRGAAGTRRKLPTTRTMKAAGCRITVEHRKGLDDELLVQALREAADQIEVRRQEAA